MAGISASRWSEFGGNQDRFDSFLPPKERKNDSDEIYSYLPFLLSLGENVILWLHNNIGELLQTIK